MGSDPRVRHAARWVREWARCYAGQIDPVNPWGSRAVYGRASRGYKGRRRRSREPETRCGGCCRWRRRSEHRRHASNLTSARTDIQVRSTFAAAAVLGYAARLTSARGRSPGQHLAMQRTPLTRPRPARQSSGRRARRLTVRQATDDVPRAPHEPRHTQQHEQRQPKRPSPATPSIPNPRLKGSSSAHALAPVMANRLVVLERALSSFSPRGAPLSQEP